MWPSVCSGAAAGWEWMCRRVTGETDRGRGREAGRLAASSHVLMEKGRRSLARGRQWFWGSLAKPPESWSQSCLCRQGLCLLLASPSCAWACSWGSSQGGRAASLRLHCGPGQWPPQAEALRGPSSWPQRCLHSPESPGGSSSGPQPCLGVCPPCSGEFSPSGSPWVCAVETHSPTGCQGSASLVIMPILSSALVDGSFSAFRGGITYFVDTLFPLSTH